MVNSAYYYFITSLFILVGICAFIYFINSRSILVGDHGKENYLGSFLVANFVFNYFVDSFFESLVVGVLAGDAYVAVKDALSMVGWLGFLYGYSAKMGVHGNNSAQRGFNSS